MLRAKRDDNPVVPRPLRPLKLADAERTISLTWLDLGSVTNVMEEPAVELPLLTGRVVQLVLDAMRDTR